MATDPQSFVLSKEAYRRKLAAMPIGEKLRMLDALREREIAIRGPAAVRKLLIARTYRPDIKTPSTGGPRSPA